MKGDFITKSQDFLNPSECITALAASARIDFVSFSRYSKEMTSTQKPGNTEVVVSDSNSAACYAAMGSELCEKRSLAVIEGPVHEEIAICASLRLPIVFVNFSKNMLKESALTFFAENNQELIDMIITAYRISEDKKVSMPVVINFQNFGMRESVQVPTQQSIDKFLPKLHLQQKISKDPVYIMTQKNEQQQNIAMQNAAVLVGKVSEAFWQRFRRSSGFFETYMTEDADHIIISAGINTINSRRVITNVRASGKKIGIIKLKILRPFPEELRKAIENKKIAVLDSNSVPGLGGNIYNEIKILKNDVQMNCISDRIPSEKDFEEISKKLVAGSAGTYWI